MRLIPAYARFCLLCLPALAQAQQEPTLPEGLSGLSSGGGWPVITATEAPAPEAVTESIPDSPKAAVSHFSGSVEMRHAARLRDDPLQGPATVSELRFQLEGRFGRDFIWNFSADGVLDDVAEDEIDLREANVVFRLGPSVDVKLGRQILTWGTGDLLFVNDLFPKDYQSFIGGRADDYLKAPADALRLSAYSDMLNADLVVMAPGQTDRFVDGSRLSFTDPNTGLPSTAIQPTVDGEGVDAALRLFRTFGTVEAALYAYRGHWKSPAGQDGLGRGTFPDLAVYGASIRGPVFGGIGNLEFGYYDSLDDPTGADPSVANSESRWLVGFERDLGGDTTLGLQYAASIMQDHDAYLTGLPAEAVVADRVRDQATLRLTRLFLNQTLTVSVFLNRSPTQGDGMTRVSVDYDVTDSLSIGGLYSEFYGAADTPFGQFRDASSLAIYTRFTF